MAASSPSITLHPRLRSCGPRRLPQRGVQHVAIEGEARDRLIEEGLPGERIHVVANGHDGPAAAVDRESARRELGLAGDEIVIGQTAFRFDERD